MKGLPARGPLVLRTLDDFHVWPVKHRHWLFELVEDEDHDLWARTDDLRNFFERFPSDKALKALHHRHMLYDKSARTHYLALRLARMELLKSKGHPMHQDILKLLDWLDRNVLAVVARKRAVRKLDEDNGLRAEYARAVSGLVPVSHAHPRLDETTLPLTPEERWALEQTEEGPRKVYHPEARPIRVGWDHFARVARLWLLGTARAYWRGERGLPSSFWVGLGLLWLPWGFANLTIPESLDWTTHYRRVMWVAALLVPLAVVTSGLYTVMLSRSMLRARRQRKHLVFAWCFYLLVIPLGLTNLWDSYEEELLQYWWASVRGQYQPMTVYADPHLGRIRATGPMRYGSAEAMEKVLQENPRYTLIELESPGGHVVEGFRMAQLLADRKMDTVVLGECASACTFLFVTGQERYLGPNARMGFHRSGRRNVFSDAGWSVTDHKIAQLYGRFGTSGEFVRKALKEPIYRVWWAPHDDMYASGYANKAWMERKIGY